LTNTGRDLEGLLAKRLSVYTPGDCQTHQSCPQTLPGEPFWY
jgi:hypothetical protein